MSAIKNSGILRYRFDDTYIPQPPGVTPPGVFPSLAGGGPPILIQCVSGHPAALPAPASTPDIDDQLFGETPGHAAIAASAFFPAVPAVAGAESVGPRPGADKATIRIPGGSKVTTFFDAYQFAAPAVATNVEIKTQVVESPIQFGGASQGGPSYLASLLVQIQCVGGAQVVSGILVVRVEHSLIDLPGDLGQSAVPNVPPPPP